MTIRKFKIETKVERSQSRKANERNRQAERSNKRVVKHAEREAA